MYYRNSKCICFIWSKINLIKINLYLTTKFYGSFHTDHNPKATHLNVCMLSSIWTRSCFWIGVSTLTKYFLIHYSDLHFILLLLSPFLLLYFQRLHTSDNDHITYLGFTFVLRKELLPLYFFAILFQVGKQS